MKILKYESLRNHLEKEFDTSISIVKYKTKDEIRKSSIPLGLKPISIFNEVSQEMRFIYSKYKLIKSQITRNINKFFMNQNIIKQ